MNYKKSNITSISELATADGGRKSTPIFKGNMFPIFVKVTKEEFEKLNKTA